MDKNTSQNLTLEFKDKDLVPLLFGEHNTHISYLEEKLGLSIADRGNTLTLSGAPATVKKAEKVLSALWERLEKNEEVGTAEIDAALRFLEASKGDKKMTNTNAKKNSAATEILIKTKRKSIAPRSPNQSLYVKSILSAPMTFGLGPAGTGKTYLAVAAGVSLYLQGAVERLIFCRPAVEAGENLGFLPGDMQEKVDPYFRPIYDALQDMLPHDLLLNKMEAGEIEVAPLAFMRGRTLSNAFIIMDEAQNTTCTQMKMFLTRMGENSKMVITGDMSQTDLPRHEKSGLRDAIDILENIEEVHFIHFTKKDVVRHPLVSKIVHAYDKRG